MLDGLVAEYARRGTGSSLRLFGCGGAPVPPDSVRRAGDQLRAHVTRAYGSTEFPTLTWNVPGVGPDRLATTDGRAVGAARLRVVDDAGVPLGPGELGEIEAIGPERCVGYLDGQGNRELFAGDGWLRTGDLGTLDADGFLTVQGRTKDVIIRSGENISPAEIEQILRARPEIEDAAVIGLADAAVGERACAVVQSRGGVPVTLDMVRDWMSESGLSRRKWPESVRTVEQLPRTATGKIAKSALIEQARG
jgi:cyclohexanecarboxylate-CoA ligase